ncbi:hypothetical protein CLOLEP_00711 [[Clostridium] leptum DSM 753]|uniref:Uncharacterized protein n=1 Tax=[Clostridium] leptum DSM 753 TaxID=428125 RepID=A7VQ84_9FIRM|nr:hypothetical protein CLOLEP_00711 [[Clostridium] leptum DSM 753]
MQFFIRNSTFLLTLYRKGNAVAIPFEKVYNIFGQ